MIPAAALALAARAAAGRAARRPGRRGPGYRFVGALPAALLVMLASGLIWGPYGAIETATIQRMTPPRRHGTVFGIRRGIQVAATAAGAAAGGLLLTRLPPQAVIGWPPGPASWSASSACCTHRSAALPGPRAETLWPAHLRSRG